jgi:hypothetical protein
VFKIHTESMKTIGIPCKSFFKQVNCEWIIWCYTYIQPYIKFKTWNKQNITLTTCIIVVCRRQWFYVNRVGVMLYNATFSNISVISWRYVHWFISTSETTKVQTNYDMKGVTVEAQSGQSLLLHCMLFFSYFTVANLKHIK